MYVPSLSMWQIGCMGAFVSVVNPQSAIFALRPRYSHFVILYCLPLLFLFLIAIFSLVRILFLSPLLVLRYIPLIPRSRSFSSLSHLIFLLLLVLFLLLPLLFLLVFVPLIYILLLLIICFVCTLLLALLGVILLDSSVFYFLVGLVDTPEGIIIA